MKAKHISKGMDQIYDDLQPNNAYKFETMPVDEDLPGLGQHYCVHCVRYFMTDKSLGDHKRTKVHKQMVKRLKEKPFDLKEAALLHK